MGRAAGDNRSSGRDKLNLPKGFPVIVMVNGSSCSDPAHTVLKEEDGVLVSPVMAGG